ncbi:TrmB family transcriptional regulator [Salinibaculum rarum]|uniref:TrmB family transcriptional regulator n=1 Tax=Salinibaculum rarum TaxID=3058903 RepID=UPI00265FA9DA|nr:helix-turn-helix domain-containing protein [Salinibaculum sp. KK48]
MDQQRGNIEQSDAIDALEKLDLRRYEAEVFVSLQKLGDGTANDVAEISDVPRSQVYGATDHLEEIGLVEVQRSKPLVYRPIPIEEARKILRSQYKDREDIAFQYLHNVRGEKDRSSKIDDGIWEVKGEDSITNRIQKLVTTAESQVKYGDVNFALDSELKSKFIDLSDEGVSLSFFGNCKDNNFEQDIIDASVESFPAALSVEECAVQRFLLVDSSSFLLSTSHCNSGRVSERAVWSSNTDFATVFVRLINI